mmetsp:Transcript_54236/g.79496  ORF Transcript_54236/g.79496 Transcript_54236/m.79496 type:complete len:338 (-) Transcript_54236:41-1054(-)
MGPRPVFKRIAAARSWARVPGPCVVARSRVFQAWSARRSGALYMVGSQAMSIEDAKKAAGYKAVDDHVQSGMVVGLGTGSTAYFAVERVGQKLTSGELKDVICIPTSERTREQAASLGIPLCTLNEKSSVDVAIDGADAVDPNMCLIKGGGGALLREKMVEAVSAKFICIVDETKLCTGLGPSFPLPVEITPFCHEHTMRIVATLTELAGCKAVLRTGDCSNNKSQPGGQPAVTDNGNYIVDLHFERNSIPDVTRAAHALKHTVGVVEHGIFQGMVYQTIIAYKDGTCRVAGSGPGAEVPWWGGGKKDPGPAQDGVADARQHLGRALKHLNLGMSSL